MAYTYELISTYTVPSATSSVTMSSIPATYTDLVIVGNYTVVNGGGVGFSCRFNSDSGSNYEFEGFYGSGTGSNTFNKATAYTMTYLAIADNAQRTTTVAFVNNYANSATYRTVLAHSGNAIFNSGYTGNWNNVSSAIDSVTFVCDGGSNISSGSKFTLYGIKKA